MKSCTVGEYLLSRLHQSGIDHLFGVPGDYNLRFLDQVINSPDIAWVGCANELNAAYAADGYARCRGAGALLTTFGVGELSALNGVAGSYAEYLPVVHIVGAPARENSRSGLLLHHTLGDGDYDHFLRISQEVTAAQAVLTPENAAAEIDRLLQIALHARRPVYIYLATDVAEASIAAPAAALSTPQLAAPQVAEAFSRAVEQRFAAAKSVALLADFLADRAGLRPALHQFLTEIPMPFATLLMGKSVLPESLNGFAGTYAGAASAGKTQSIIERAEVIITLGVRYTDSITAGFTQQIDSAKTIAIDLHESQIGEEAFSPLPMVQALEIVHQLARRYTSGWNLTLPTPPALSNAPSDRLTQSTLWQAMQDFLRPGDIVLADQGTAAFGAAVLRLPEEVTFICQPLWGSIGYTLPAAYGAQIAAPERRVVLLIGDGAAQLTIQELGSMLRDGLKPVIFVLNNSGYTVERAIHGEHQRYNDIAEWNWTQLPGGLSVRNEAQSWRITETAQLVEVMQVIAQTSRLSLVEVVLPQMDIPPLLQSVSASMSQRNGG